MRVGANAYVLKSGFNSANLLDIVREVGTQTRRLSVTSEWDNTFRDGIGWGCGSSHLIPPSNNSLYVRRCLWLGRALFRPVGHNRGRA